MTNKADGVNNNNLKVDGVNNNLKADGVSNNPKAAGVSNSSRNKAGAKNKAAGLSKTLGAHHSVAGQTLERQAS